MLLGVRLNEGLGRTGGIWSTGRAADKPKALPETTATLLAAASWKQRDHQTAIRKLFMCSMA
jgi:hypothetical protein